MHYQIVCRYRTTLWTPTSDGHRSPLCTMLQVDGAQCRSMVHKVVLYSLGGHNVALTNPRMNCLTYPLQILPLEPKWYLICKTSGQCFFLLIFCSLNRKKEQVRDGQSSLYWAYTDFPIMSSLGNDSFHYHREAFTFNWFPFIGAVSPSFDVISNSIHTFLSYFPLCNLYWITACLC